MNAGVIVCMSGWSTNGVVKFTADENALSRPALSLNLTCTEYAVSKSKVPAGTVRDVLLPVSPLANVSAVLYTVTLSLTLLILQKLEK